MLDFLGNGVGATMISVFRALNGPERQRSAFPRSWPLEGGWILLLWVLLPHPHPKVPRGVKEQHRAAGTL